MDSVYHMMSSKPEQNATKHNIWKHFMNFIQEKIIRNRINPKENH